MRNLIIVAASFGGILLFLLASASANTALFASHYPWLLGLNAIVALSLFALIVWQVRDLWQEHRAKVFGSRLKLRLMLMFGLMAVLPGILIYAVSVQFVTKSIETWFDVRVEKHSSPVSILGAACWIRCLTNCRKKGGPWRLTWVTRLKPNVAWRSAVCASRAASNLRHFYQ